jgi:SAM-dependent methyltransferase
MLPQAALMAHASTPEHEPETLSEIRRIEAEYRQRDALGTAGALYSFSRPSHVVYVQELEWQLLRVLRDAQVDLANTRVLDVGCGFGYIAHRFAEYGARETTGVDLLQHRIETARRRYPALSFARADATQLPFEDASFELVTQFTCLSSVLDVAVRDRIVGELWRVVAPGGVLVSYDLAPAGVVLRALRAWQRRATHTSREPQPRPTATLPVSLRELRRGVREDPVITRHIVLSALLPEAARASRIASQLLVRVPGLRSHLLVAFRKGRGPT